MNSRAVVNGIELDVKQEATESINVIVKALKDPWSVKWSQIAGAIVALHGAVAAMKHSAVLFPRPEWDTAPAGTDCMTIDATGATWWKGQPDLVDIGNGLQWCANQYSTYLGLASK